MAKNNNKKVEINKKVVDDNNIIVINDNNFKDDKMYVLNAEENKEYGRLYIEYVAHVIHEDKVETNKNSINWQEQYVRDNLESAKNMPLKVNFDWDGMPSGHGWFDVDVDGEVVSDGAVIVGMNTNAEIKEFEINGSERLGLVCNGYVDSIMYKNLVMWIKNRYYENKTIDTSVEIAPKRGNDSIIYEQFEDSCKIPAEYTYIGSAILGVEPADNYAILTEVSSALKKQKEEELKKVKLEEAIKKIEVMESEAIKVTEDHKAELDAKDVEHKETLEVKEAEYVKTLEEKEAELTKITEEKETIEAELNEFKTAKLVSDFETETSFVSEDIMQSKETEINEFKATPTEDGKKALINSINAAIVAEVKKGNTVVINSVETNKNPLEEEKPKGKEDKSLLDSVE